MVGKLREFWDNNRSIIFFIVITVLLINTLGSLIGAIFLLSITYTVDTLIIGVSLFISAFISGAFAFAIIRFRNRGN